MAWPTLPVSGSIETNAQKCPLVYPKATGDREQNPGSHKSGRYTPKNNKNYERIFSKTEP